jgi:hypothetical protein
MSIQGNVSRGLRVGEVGTRAADSVVVLEDHIQEVVVLDVLDPPCVYTTSLRVM